MVADLPDWMAQLPQRGRGARGERRARADSRVRLERPADRLHPSAIDAEIILARA
jgi:hypothetical protein